VRETGSFSLEGLRGFDLKGKTLGVVGTGRIGKHVVRIANGFEMNVLACDSYPDEKFAKEMGFKYLPLEDVLRASDVVTLHVPYMKETHHLINAKTIKLMKHGAYLVNTSRGAVVETDALVKALQEKQLGGAALDVLEEEGAIKDELNILAFGHPEEHNMKTILEDHVLIDMPNVLITPHNAFNSAEGLTRILDTTVENIAGFVNGKAINPAPKTQS
jgi:D-lactate dehydrogenase